MKSINLKDYYPWYTHNEFVEVSDEVAEVLSKNKRYIRSCNRKLYRNNAQYSLDADERIENYASFTAMTPFEVLEYKERFCRLCRALNSLPEIQSRRVEAHYILNMTKAEIARDEGVSEGAVKESIRRGLKAMKKFLRNF